MNEMMKRVKAQLIEQKEMLTTTKVNTHALEDRIRILSLELKAKHVESDQHRAGLEELEK